MGRIYNEFPEGIIQLAPTMAADSACFRYAKQISGNFIPVTALAGN